MRAWLRGFGLPAGLCAVMLLGGCERRATRSAPPAPAVTPPAVADTATAHAAPAQPAGPQVGRGDALINAARPRLAPWAAMWREALPGFAVDSLWSQGREKWTPVLRDTFDGVWPVRDSPGDSAYEVFGLPSPDRRHVLEIDTYQVVEVINGELQIGGEPDSRTDLIDVRTRQLAAIQIQGTAGGAHWGAWLDSNRFALGQWREADDFGEWYQGQLGIYSIADSTVAWYATRIVPTSQYERYTAAWEAWVGMRYRAVTKRRS